MLAHRVRRALQHPRRVPPYVRQWVRNTYLRMRSDDHLDFYRRVVRANARRRGPEFAVGSATHEEWLFAGRLQFDYLLAHGLTPSVRMLDIGCGNLRAGHLFIDHLDAGNYYGIDVSPEILRAALETIADFGLQEKLPRLALVDDLRFSFLPDQGFDIVHAHSVFSHSPLEVIEECLRHVGRIMAPGAFFDFTFGRTDGDEYHVLNEGFYYRTDHLVALAADHGFQAWFMEDWEQGLHPQSKLRLARSA